MKLNQELIDKCIKYRDWLDLEGKISMYHNFKYELQQSETYNDFLHNIAECYIIAFSMFEKGINIDYRDYMEIIGSELVENLDNLIDKKNEKEKGGWDLMSDTIISKMENILKD